MILPPFITDDLASKGIKFTRVESVSGGDINEAAKLSSSNGRRCFLKFNQGKNGASIIQSEIDGLRILRDTSNPTPTLITTCALDQGAYILMEWIEPSGVKINIGAKILSDLHHNTNRSFGLERDNHIGSLHQKNGWYDSFVNYYMTSRIEPQVKLAVDNGYNLYVDLSQFSQVIKDTIPDEAPALIHGDLWGGNMIHGADGPYLIDPSISFGHREMDLAMMRLFGGFADPIFDAYADLFPLDKGWQGRAELFQVYYLLVHLNIFGSSYLSSVTRIFGKYC